MQIKESLRLSLTWLLVISLLVVGFVRPAPAQERRIVVSIGQPNIWSLEQAHYLLARMHRQNLDLQTAQLASIDPNETNAQRVDIVKLLVSAGFKYDEAVGMNNQLLKSDKTFNSQRRQDLLQQRSSLQAQRTQISTEITELKIAKSKSKDDDEKAVLQEQIDAKTEQKAAVDDELSKVNEELSGLSSATGNFESAGMTTEGFDPSKFGTASKLDALMPTSLITPKIAAAQRLDNHIGMQYEIIAKQLTLLRDEVGPGERLVFLELPQSINPSQGQEKNKLYGAVRGLGGMSSDDSADNQMVQVWWRIGGYTRVDKEVLFASELANLEVKINAIRATLGSRTTVLLDLQILRQRALDRSRAELAIKRARLDNLTRLATSPEEKAEISILTDQVSRLDAQVKLDEKNLTDAQNVLGTATGVQSSLPKSLDAEKALLESRLAELCKLQVELENKRFEAEKRVAANKAKLSAERAKDSPTKGSATAATLKLFEDECKEIETDLKLLENTIREIEETLKTIDGRQIKFNKEEAKLVQSLIALYSKYEKLKLQAQRNKIKSEQNALDRLLQGGSRNTSEVVAKTIELLGADASNYPKSTSTNTQGTDGRKYSRRDAEGREFVSVAFDAPATAQGRTGILRDRSVRVIDVIPRQNAINVDARKESVKASGIVAAFSFLFGFGGNVRYQRQKEEYEGFLNQELYTSGFGKGDTDFGWSFFPFAGTRQMAPGLRTTYAVAVVPDDAETIVLRAQGCHFARREKQPENYDAANSWKTGKESSRCLDREQIFVVPVPGGSSDGSDFYVTELRYSPNRLMGERMVASIYGQNISPQIGVTIDGVPLTQAVGLAQTGVESILNDKVAENCTGLVPCGRFERISSEQILISFKMHDGAKPGTPRIALIAPGKAIEINTLNLSVNGVDDVKLDDSPWMFGRPTAEAPRFISDFKAAPDPRNRPNHAGQQSIGVVSGKFESDDTFYVNGTLAQKQLVPGSQTERACKTANLCIIEFPSQQTDLLTVTVVPGTASQDKDAISRTFVNPVQLRIINASVARYDKDGKILTVVLDGSGYDDSIDVAVNSPGTIERRLTPSNGQMILEIKTPAPIVHITLRDRFTNNAVSTIVATPGS
jgi:hypothetical protein